MVKAKKKKEINYEAELTQPLHKQSFAESRAEHHGKKKVGCETSTVPQKKYCGGKKR